MRFIKEFGIDKYFDGFFISGNIGYEKPRKELYNYAMQTAGCAKGIMVGDNPIADVDGAKSVGLKTVYVHGKEDTNADYVCENLSEVVLIAKDYFSE